MTRLSTSRAIRNLTSYQTIYQAREHSIPVNGSTGARLVPVGAWVLTQSHIIEAMSRWRAAARDMYFARFPESVDSMREYLTSSSIETETAILFIIEHENGELLGHLGLKDIAHLSAEVDSVMRNPDVRITRIMELALRTLINWSEEALGLTKLSLQVISYNTRALALYREVGFAIVDERPLFRTINQDRVRHQQVSASEANVDYTAVVMEMHLHSSL